MNSGTDFIPVAKPWFDKREEEAASRAIASGWVTQGPEVLSFETEFADIVGAKYACAVSSCTTALHLALLAIGIQQGDEVITVSHSFIATANAIRYCGAIPIFIDIEPRTFNMNPDLIEQVISKRTKAILCVHQIGLPCDLANIIRIARKHSIPVIEDAACAVGSEIIWNGTWECIGKPHGDIACFSFHPRKVVTTGDGGMITTSNADYDRQFRLLRQHAMSVPAKERHSADKIIFENYPVLGYNYRMTDIQAAIGREQLRKLPEMIERRRFLAKRYSDLLKDIPELILPEEPPWARFNWQSYCIRLPEDCDQRYVMQALLDFGIATRRGVMCAHRESAYHRDVWSCGTPRPDCDCAAGSCQRLKESERAQDRSIILPLYHQMTEQQQDTVVNSLHVVCAS
jgi:perosamine synthetase